MSTLINSIALGQSIIPYRKELRELCGSATAVLLFSQLLYWFEKNDYQTFYKFISPCPNQLYKEGDSWTEELGFSYEEFSTAFSKIGEKFVSKTAFEKGFENEKMFYSYTDKIRGLTFWGINKNLIEKNLTEIYENPKSRNSGMSNYVNGESQITELGNVKLDLKQKTNTEEYTEYPTTTNPTPEDPKLKFISLKNEFENHPMFESTLSRLRKIPKEIIDEEIGVAIWKYIKGNKQTGIFNYVRTCLLAININDQIASQKLETEKEISTKRTQNYDKKTNLTQTHNQQINPTKPKADTDMSYYKNIDQKAKAKGEEVLGEYYANLQKSLLKK